MLKRGDRVLLAGVSVRALAQSAARAGYRVTAVDAFGDMDLRAVADVVALRSDAGASYSAGAAARAARYVAAAGVAYTADFENYPCDIAELAVGRRLLGNAPDVVARVRQPVRLAHVLRRLGFATPATRASALLGASGATGRWLVKPRRSGGGRGVHAWRRGTAIRRGAYLQERIDGVPGSIAFVADGRRAVPLGLSRQLVGGAAFGARGFRYGGSLVGAPRTLFDDGERVHTIAAALADAVTTEFGLVGVNGIDFIVRDGVPYPTEVNPRYSASMELIEQAYGTSMFETHVRACGGELPAPVSLDDIVGVHGKAIVFAPQALRMGNTAAWLGGAHGDVPRPGERIARGRAVCTVFAQAHDPRRCLTRLAAGAGDVVASPIASPAARRTGRSAA